jgi:hypothetical protein
MATIKNIAKTLKANKKSSERNAEGIEKLTDAIGQMTSRLEQIAENQTIIVTRQNKWFKPLAKLMQTPKLITSAVKLITDNPITRLTSSIVEAVVFPFKTVTNVMKKIFGLFKKSLSFLTAPFRWLFGKRKEKNIEGAANIIRNEILAQLVKLNELMTNAFNESTKEQKKKKRKSKQDEFQETENDREAKGTSKTIRNSSLPLLPVSVSNNSNSNSNNNSNTPGLVASATTGALTAGAIGFGTAILRGIKNLLTRKAAPAAARFTLGRALGFLARKLALPLALVIPDQMGDGTLDPANMTPEAQRREAEQRAFTEAENEAQRQSRLIQAPDWIKDAVDPNNSSGSRIVPRESATREAARMMQRVIIKPVVPVVPEARLIPESVSSRNIVDMSSTLGDLNTTIADLKAYLANPGLNVIDSSSSQVVNNNGSTVNVGKSASSGDAFNGGIGLRQ